MKRPLKILFASAVIMAYLFNPGAALAETDGSLGLIPIPQEDTKNEENVKETVIYIYGRILKGTYEEVSSVKDPEGMEMLTGSFSSDPNDYDGKHTTETKGVYWSLGKASDEYVAANGLIPLGTMSVPYFYMEETFAGEEYPTVYITTDPTGPGKVVNPVTWEEAEVHVIQNANTNAYDVVSYSRAKELITTGDWLHVGPATRENVLAAGKGVPTFFHDGAESNISQGYFEVLDSISAQQDVPGMGR